MREVEFPVEKGSTMTESHDEIKEPAAAPESSKKKPYSTPELVIHGSVERITEENKGAGQYDGINTRRSR